MRLGEGWLRAGQAALLLLLLVLLSTLLIGYGYLWPAAELPPLLPPAGLEALSRCSPQEYEGFWSIGILKGRSPLDWSLPGPSNPVMTCADSTDVPATFVADPFLLLNGSDWWMFFELKNGDTAQGDIGLASSRDGGTSWHYEGVVLDEPLHMSYPFVFQHQTSFWMIPETVLERKVVLYEAVDFPYVWRRAAVLLEDVDVVDATPLQWQGRWYMFTGVRHRNDLLRLFWAADLFGPWQLHPQSEARPGNFTYSRPAGRPALHQGQLYRFVQEDLFGMYGYAVHALRVLELTPTDFREEVALTRPLLEGSQRAGDWNEGRMHHIDPQQLPDGSWIAAVDGDRVLLTTLY
jgi:hypothetical protein